ncbi:La-related protein 7 [Frankliniella fusca]|uniref:La-related protein 7 n=1 Tax=Frankliniella fusca TaxID=407009 RepID=A0AAE1I238_9NEOP|nr:La-related protein 7 [Frankliniella fusca]
MDWMLPHGAMGGGHPMFIGDGYECTEENGKGKGRKRKKQLYKTVRDQMEFYFGDANLSKDRYLRQLVEENPYVPLEIFLKFNKIIKLVSTVEEIAKAVKKSEILELSEDSLKVRRKTPMKIKDNEDDCTVYVENLPPEISHDELSKVFSEFGKVVYVSIPKYANTQQRKGFAFVEFDTPKDAEETIRIFKEKGSCLSPHMLPEKLCSIRTFENQNTPAPDFHNTSKIVECTIETKDETEGSPTPCPVKEEILKSNVDDSSFSTKSSKKRKLENDEEGNLKKKDKRNHETVSMNEDCESVEPSVKDEENKSDVDKENDTSANESSQENKIDGSSTEKKKKKNRKKKKRPKEFEIFAQGMVVLSKKEWKRLRNKYLNMQRVNMRKVKQQVLEARFMRRQPHCPPYGLDHGRDEEMRPPPPPVDAPKPRVTFVPGVIVCVKFNEPMVDLKAFKAEARTQPGVQYVDVTEGAFEAFLRCSGPAEAQHLLQIKFWKNMSVLSGGDEKAYWDKISKDREAKLGNKVKVVKERGKKKLLRKAEVVKATHLHFEN